MRVLYFFRNDLRLSDNQTLSRALELATEIAFAYSPTRSHLRAGIHRQNFLKSNTQALLIELMEHEHTCLIVNEAPATLAQKHLHEFDAFAMAIEPTFEEQQDLLDLQTLCSEKNKVLISFDSGSLLDWSTLPFEVTKLPKVFTDFRKKIEPNLKVPSLSLAPSLDKKGISLNKSPGQQMKLTKEPFRLFSGGERAAKARLEHYLWGTHAIETYKETRNGLLNFDDSSKLSPWLSVGALSPRQIYWELKKYEDTLIKNESTYWLLFELLWREYFRLYAYLHQNRIFQIEGPFKTKREYEPSNDENIRTFEQWQKGETPNAFVNAGMKELAQTGFLSNRLRQNVASYLCKTLNLPWTWGATYFEECLIDYDASSNWGNWNYVAGVGTDPRDRIFNPDRQAEMYDPEGDYRKKWLS